MDPRNDESTIVLIPWGLWVICMFWIWKFWDRGRLWDALYETAWSEDHYGAIHVEIAVTAKSIVPHENAYKIIEIQIFFSR